MSESDNKLNIYVCRACKGHIVTRDVDEGTTPFMTGCKATPGCRGIMQSSMYRVFDQTMAEGWQWYKPTNAEAVAPNVREHVKMGGLLLRRVDQREVPE